LCSCATEDEITRYRVNLQGEVDGRGDVPRHGRARGAAAARRRSTAAFAATEESHAAFWRKTSPRRASSRRRRGPAGDPVPNLGSRALRPGPGPADAAHAGEIDRDHDDRQPNPARTLMPAQERSHARVLSRLSARCAAAWDGAAYSSLEAATARAAATRCASRGARSQRRAGFQPQPRVMGVRRRVFAADRARHRAPA